MVKLRNACQSESDPCQHLGTHAYIHIHYIYTNPALNRGHGAQSAHVTTSWEELKILPKQLKKQQIHAHPPLRLSRSKQGALICYENLGFRDCKQEKYFILPHFSICIGPKWSERLLTFPSLPLCISILEPPMSAHTHAHTHTHTFRPIWQDSQKCCSQTWVVSVTLSGGQT